MPVQQSLTARSVVVDRLSGVGGLVVREFPVGVELPDHDVLVEVHAVAPAFPDLLLCKGEYQVKPELPFVLGSDFAGIVRDVPLGSALKVGERVAGCLSYGAAGELVMAPENRLYRIPNDLTFEVAAALPMNYLTAYYALVIRGQVQVGEWVFITGASGGVGQAAIQLAKGLGCTVVAHVSSESKREAVVDAGADHAVTPEELLAAVKELTDGKGVNLVLDVVGGDVTNLLRVLAPFGRLMIVGFASGEIPQVRVNRLLLTNTDVRGVESARMFTAHQTQDAWVEIMRFFEEGFIRPRISQFSGLEQYASALKLLENRALSGRAVISVEREL